MLAIAMGLVGAVLLTFGRDDRHHRAFDESPSSAAPWTPMPQPDGETVSLTVDFGNGARREFDALPWSEGMTLGDLMQQAQEFRPGIAFTRQGEGTMALLTSLEGVANEAGSGRYWLYRIDGRHGETSFAVCPLEPGAHVLWEFRRGE
jgi:hypothetical protein